MDDGLSDADVFGGDQSSVSAQPTPQGTQGWDDSDVFGGGVTNNSINPKGIRPQDQGASNRISGSESYSANGKEQPNYAVDKKSNDLDHTVALLEKSPPMPTSDQDDFGQFAGKTAFNQVKSALPYFFDRNPDLNGSQRTADMVKSGLTGVGQAVAGAATVPMDIAHNVGEWAGNKIGEGITGVETQPDYSNYTGNTFKKLGLDYEPQTAGGQSMQLAGNLMGPKVLAVPGKVAGAAGDVAGTMKSGWQLPKGDELQQMSTDLYNGTNDTYRAMRQNGTVYNPDSIEELRWSVNRALTNSDIIPKLRPVTTDAVQAINDAADQGTLSLNHLDQFRRLLRDASGEDSAAAGAVRKAIDNHVNQTDASDLVNGSPDAVAWLNRGRAEYTRAANFDDVSTVLQRANGDPTKIKNMLNTFLTKPENTMGMTQDEVAALRRASQTSTGEAMSKMLGKAGFTILPTNAQGNGILPYLMAAGENGAKGGALFLPHGPPLVAAGTVSKAGNTLYGRGLANDALNMIKDRDVPPPPGAPPGTPQLNAPPVYGGSPSGPTPPVHVAPQKLLPRGDQDTYYIPQGRALSYQPRADFEGTADGLIQKPSNVVQPRTSPADRAPIARAGQETADRNVKRLMITYQPRPDFIATDNGIVQPPSNRVGTLLGEDQNMPIDKGELQAIRNNPKWSPEESKAFDTLMRSGKIDPDLLRAAAPPTPISPEPGSYFRNILNKGESRGGPVNKAKGGAVTKRPKSYPAIKKMRERA